MGLESADLSVYKFFLRMSNDCHGRAERGAILPETCILYRFLIVPFISSLIPLPTEWLYKLYYHGSCSMPYLINDVGDLSMYCQRHHFKHVACPPRPGKHDRQIYTYKYIYLHTMLVWKCEEQHNFEIAQIPRLRGTYTLQQNPHDIT